LTRQIIIWHVKLLLEKLNYYLTRQIITWKVKLLFDTWKKRLSASGKQFVAWAWVSTFLIIQRQEIKIPCFSRQTVLSCSKARDQCYDFAGKKLAPFTHNTAVCADKILGRKISIFFAENRSKSPLWHWTLFIFLFMKWSRNAFLSKNTSMFPFHKRFLIPLKLYPAFGGYIQLRS
jgi:hypothetical protein